MKPPIQPKKGTPKTSKSKLEDMPMPDHGATIFMMDQMIEHKLTSSDGLPKETYEMIMNVAQHFFAAGYGYAMKNQKKRQR